MGDHLRLHASLRALIGHGALELDSEPPAEGLLSEVLLAGRHGTGKPPAPMSHAELAEYLEDGPAQAQPPAPMSPMSPMSKDELAEFLE